VALTVLALGVIVPARAHAAAWLAPGPLSDPGADSAQVAMAPDGTAVAVWVREIEGESEVEASIRPPGGGFGNAAVVSDGGGDALQPHVAINSAGAAAVVWRTDLPDSADTQRIEAAVRAPGAPAFDPAEVIREVARDDNETDDVADPHVAVGPDGRTIAVWHHDREIPPEDGPGSTESAIEAAIRPVTGGFVPDLGETCSGGCDQLDGIQGAFDDTHQLRDPEIAIDGDGGAVAVWSRLSQQASSDTYAIYFSRRPLGGAFQDTRSDVTSSSNERQQNPQVTTNAQGEIVFVWQAGTAPNALVKARIREDSGALALPQTVSGSGADPPGVTSQPNGTTVVLWAGQSSKAILASTRPPGGSFPEAGSAAAISGDVLGSETVDSPRIAANPFGTMFAVWHHQGDREGLGIRASLLRPGGSFEAPLPISAVSSATEPEIAADAQGDAVAIWNNGGTIEGAFYDGDAPAVPPAAAGAAPVAPAVSDLSAPVLQSLTVANKRFAVGSEQTALSAAKRRRAPRGTTFRYSLSEPATVRIAIERARPGRRVGSVCRRATRKLRKKRRCTRFVASGTLTRRAASGTNSTRFSGRLGSKALRPGRYRASVSATDRARNRSRARRVSFNVVRY
jgi:hypothetical protein